jgi:hypothetical protein
MASKLRCSGPAIVILLRLLAYAASAIAQSVPDTPKTAEQFFKRGFIDADLVAEKKLLADKSKQFGWADFPMLQFPRKLIYDKGAVDKFGEQMAHELFVKHLAEQQKKFVETRLKGRSFVGEVRIGRVDKSNGAKKLTVFGREPVRPENPNMGVAYILSPYECQWDCDSADGFDVGLIVKIKGSILDLKEEGDVHRYNEHVHCLYLENVSRQELDSKR